MKGKTIVNVQFLRAFAAFAVVLFHTSDHFFAIGGSSSGNVFSFFKLFGYAGVDVFFVISGYIIWVSTRKIDGLKGVLGYAYNRATRIYLGYWPYFIILVLLGYFFAPKLIENIDFIGSFFLTQSNLNILLLKVSWTLKYELYFYLCFAILLFFPKKYLIVILTSIFTLIIGVQLWGVLEKDIYKPDNFVYASRIYTFYMSPYCLEFLLGCFAGYFFEKNRIKSLVPVLLIGLSFFIMGLYYQENLTSGKLYWGYFMNERVIFFGIASVSMLLGLVELEKRNIVLFPKISLLLGGASYSLYLSHTIILYCLYHFGIRDLIKSMGSYQVVLMLLVVFIIVGYSILHYILIEKPLMSQSKKLRKRLIN